MKILTGDRLAIRADRLAVSSLNQTSSEYSLAYMSFGYEREDRSRRVTESVRPSSGVGGHEVMDLNTGRKNVQVQKSHDNHSNG